MGQTVFNGRWRYTEWPDGTAELYDHDNDAFEYVNLAKDGKHHAQLADMKKLLRDGWRAALPTK
jgi:arylsulfatase A-like enzyme